MKFDINTLKRATCAVIAACVLLLGAFTTTQAQRRNRGVIRGAVNGYPHNWRGQQNRVRNRYWRERRHDLQSSQRYERRQLRERWRNNQDDNDNNRNWRERRKFARRELRQDQREERREFKDGFKNRRRDQ